MKLIPVFDQANSCSSYIIGDEITGKAMVVDPLYSLGYKNYVIRAAKERLYIEHIVDTHVHADHYSAAKALCNELGIRVSMGENAPNNFEFNKLKDKQAISMGNLKVEILLAAGHTPDNIALKVIDSSRGEEAWCIFTGDSLFVGDVGRPDLAYEDEKMVMEAIKCQYDTLFNKFLSLQDYVEIFPAHTGSSSCGGLFLSPKFSSTIGYEKRHNKFLQAKSFEEFSSLIMKTLKPPPPNAREIRNWNLSKSAYYKISEVS